MDQIILDSYYLVGLFQERFKEVSLLKLNELMFLTHLESLLEDYEEGLYPKTFTLNLERYF